MKDLLFLDTMITSKIITIVYWMLLAAAVISGVGAMFDGYGFSFGRFFWGLAIIVGGSLAARIWCELLIVLFKIHENIKTLAEKSK